MASHDTARATHSNLNADSRLLGLPPELRNMVYEYVLSSAGTTCIVSSTNKLQKPGLLQVNRQIREEANLRYHALSDFQPILTANTAHLTRKWAASLTTSEIRSIESLSFDFHLSVSDQVLGLDCS